MTTSSLRASLPEATAVTLLRRYSTDPQLDEAAEKLSNCARTFKQYLAAIVVNMLGFVFGTTLGWPAMAGPQLIAALDSAANKTENATDAFGNWTDLDANATAAPDVYRPLPGPPVTLEAMSWIVAVLCISCVVGTFIFGWLADVLGRKKAALIGAVPYVVSWLCVIFADEVAWLFIARVLAGLGGGSSLVVCPLYVGETSEDSLRGMLGSLFSVMLTAGILFSFVVGSFASFRALAIVCLTLPCIFFVAFLWMPDTPVFLLSRGKVPLAVRSLTWLRGGRVDLVDDELAKLVANMKDGAEDGGGSGQAPSQLALLRQLVATRAARRALFIVMFLFTVQQWCGINAILSFTVQIFREAGSTMEPNSATIIVGVLQLVGVCSASLVVDRLGRRILLVVSYVSMCSCLLILGGVFYMKATDQDISSIGWLPVLCLSMYSVTYALGAGPVPFILVSELFPSSVRSLATSISISFCSILAFIVTKFFEDICHNIGQFGAMWVFAGCSLAGALFAWFGVIETKGKPLAVILHELEGRRPDPRTGPFAGGTKTFNPAPGDIYYSPPDRAEDREEAEATM
ncbi:facilitated trehalose transporter Tret1-2 homolog [Thrips palmi]|uniref:Facilitated trehalose transporter Tret1-2 homolog n=1 Tax=Thrips palmi TaxID=161013 RepID=A0A6P8YZW4_THRPL|nr:facilitated trehalose transporter Tret1-2 homolog [Thrips palmi]